MRTQVADSHLTYIGSASGPGGPHATRYDVYPRDGGHQLGWVYRHYSGPWTAVSADQENEKRARTRWEAAIALWGDVLASPRDLAEEDGTP